MIRASGVSKSFGDRSAVNNLSLSVGRGEIGGLIGPNGSGKTTMIRLFNGLLRPDAGSIRVNGLDPLLDGEQVRQQSGVLTESADFYRHMSALDNLKFFADLYGVTDPGRPRELLETAGLGADLNRKVGGFSTGMRKRLGFAKSLLHRPFILFLDEPTNGLDPDGTREVLETIRKLNQTEGTTILICSHLLQQLETVCHRYVFIDQGSVIEEGTLPELTSRYQPEVLLEVNTTLRLDSPEFHGRTVSSSAADEQLLTFALQDKAEVPEFLRLIIRDADVYGARVIQQGLEDLYFTIRKERLG